ncbi:MAG: hypothetical protein AAF089_14565 [Bacteroidota bacterium]
MPDLSEPDLTASQPALRDAVESDRSYRARQLDGIVQDLAEGLRASLGSIRAAIETMAEYPDMDEAVRAQFAEIVRQGAVEASERLEASMERYAHAAAAERPMHVVPAATVLHRVAEALASNEALGPSGVRTEEPGDTLLIRADRAALVGVLVYFAERVHYAVRSRPLTLRVQATGQYVAFDLQWDGPPIQPHRLERWLAQPYDDADSVPDRVPATVLERHGAEVWAQGGGTYPLLQVLLPLEG